MVARNAQKLYVRIMLPEKFDDLLRIYGYRLKCLNPRLAFLIAEQEECLAVFCDGT